MAIKAGDKVPSATLTKMGASGPEPVKTEDFFKGRKVAVFAVPGAFTPTCSLQHVPGFVQNADKLKAKGVDEIACISVNDVFVMGAWGKDQKAEGKITMLADSGADFTKALGMELDLIQRGLGIRSKHYSMLVDNGVVKQFNLEENPGEAKTSSAENMLSSL
jgi:peroxiredoxin